MSMVVNCQSSFLSPAKAAPVANKALLFREMAMNHKIYIRIEIL